jgi:membrane-bound ClpP family serine protease
VLPLAYHRYALLPILEKARIQPLMDDDGSLAGAHGRVVRALNPTGTVQVRGELWTATSEHPLEAGDEVVVIERDGLNIYVEGIKRKRESVNGHEEQE